MAEAWRVRTSVTRVLNSSRSWASEAAPRSLARDFWREPRWSMAAAAMTPRWSETALSPASFPGVSFSIGACLLWGCYEFVGLPQVILHAAAKVLQRGDCQGSPYVWRCLREGREASFRMDRYLEPGFVQRGFSLHAN